MTNRPSGSTQQALAAARQCLLDAHAHHAAYEIVEGNAQELRAAVADFVLTIKGGVPETVGITQSLKIVIRRLHNWLAACYSLRMATDVFLRQHKGVLSPAFCTAVPIRYDACFRSLVAGFVHELRGYQQHHRVPVSRGNHTIRHTRDGVKESVGVSLIVYGLLQRKRWQGPARQFLDRNPKEIDLLGLESEYSALLKSFMDWFVQALRAEFPICWEFPRDDEGSIALP